MTVKVMGFIIIGIVFLFFIGQALWGPLRFLLRLSLRLALGGAVLYLVDLAAGHFGWPGLGLNPASAATVGFLGLPGLVLLGAIKYLIG